MTVVLLHPLPLDGTIWTRCFADSESDERMIAPDLYGMGTSIHAWAEGVLDLAGPGPLTMIGNSIGGSCAIEVAVLAPDRVELLVLVGAKAGHRPEPDLCDEAVRILVDHGLERAWTTYWEPLFAPAMNEAVLAEARSIAMSQDVDAVINGVKVFHGRPDRTSFIESLDARIVVISGEHDVVARHGEAMAASLRQGSFHIVEACGHYVPLEQPARLAALVRDAQGSTWNLGRETDD